VAQAECYIQYVVFSVFLVVIVIIIEVIVVLFFSVFFAVLFMCGNVFRSVQNLTLSTCFTTFALDIGFKLYFLKKHRENSIYKEDGASFEQQFFYNAKAKLNFIIIF